MLGGVSLMDAILKSTQQKEVSAKFEMRSLHKIVWQRKQNT